MSVCLLVIKGIPTFCVSPFLIDLHLNVDYVRKLFLDISMFYLSNMLRIVQAENSNTLHSIRHSENYSDQSSEYKSDRTNLKRIDIHAIRLFFISLILFHVRFEECF